LIQQLQQLNAGHFKSQDMPTITTKDTKDMQAESDQTSPSILQIESALENKKKQRRPEGIKPKNARAAHAALPKQGLERCKV
jgi:hypothetical protein